MRRRGRTRKSVDCRSAPNQQGIAEQSINARCKGWPEAYTRYQALPAQKDKQMIILAGKHKCAGIGVTFVRDGIGMFVALWWVYLSFRFRAPVSHLAHYFLGIKHNYYGGDPTPEDPQGCIAGNVWTLGLGKEFEIYRNTRNVAPHSEAIKTAPNDRED